MVVTQCGAWIDAAQQAEMQSHSRLNMVDRINFKADRIRPTHYFNFLMEEGDEDGRESL